MTKWNKRTYTLSESFWMLRNALMSLADIRRARRTGGLPDDLFERIMLCVSEVNGCEMCSYHHAQQALEAGMTPHQIQTVLSGDWGEVPEEEVPALLFAQHYVESRGRPTCKSWDRLCALYGPALARGILGAVRMIFVGNLYGMAMGTLKHRLQGERAARDRPLQAAALLM